MMKLKLKELCSKWQYQLQLVLAAGWADTDHLLLTIYSIIEEYVVPMVQLSLTWLGPKSHRGIIACSISALHG